jgi:hypothetical protein
MSRSGQSVSRKYVTAPLKQMQEKFTLLWKAENSLCEVEVGEIWHDAPEQTFVV